LSSLRFGHFIIFDEIHGQALGDLLELDCEADFGQSMKPNCLVVLNAGTGSLERYIYIYTRVYVYIH